MNPWASIWFKPRQTIRQIVDTNPRHLVVPLFVFAGIAHWAMQALAPLVLRGVPMGIAVAIVVGLGGFLSLVGLYFFGWLYRWVGSWLGGQAKNVEVRAAIAWVEVPTFAVFVIWLASFLMTRGQIVAPGGDSTLTIASAVVIGVAMFAAGIWRVVLACHTLGEVHRFSAWKGLGTMLIPNLLISIPVSIAMMGAIAIPNVLRGRIAANEAAAIGNIRALVASLELYRSVSNNYPASTDWAQMYPKETGQEAYGPPYFETTGRLASHEVQGFLYTYNSGGAEDYVLTAAPRAPGSSASRSFYADQTGFIRHCTPKVQGETADVNDRTIDGAPLPC